MARRLVNDLPVIHLLGETGVMVQPLSRGSGQRACCTQRNLPLTFFASTLKSSSSSFCLLPVLTLRVLMLPMSSLGVKVSVCEQGKRNLGIYKGSVHRRLPPPCLLHFLPLPSHFSTSEYHSIVSPDNPSVCAGFPQA